jgi:hypothetical protein
MAQNWLGMSPDVLISRLRSLLVDLEAVACDDHYKFRGNAVFIEDWMLMRRTIPCLAGTMTGHPTVTDGSPGITTEIYFIDEDRGIARSMSRWYRLSRNPFQI